MGGLADTREQAMVVRGWLDQIDHDANPDEPDYLALTVVSYGDADLEDFGEMRYALPSDLAAFALAPASDLLLLATAVLDWDRTRSQGSRAEAQSLARRVMVKLATEAITKGQA